MREKGKEEWAKEEGGRQGRRGKSGQGVESLGKKEREGGGRTSALPAFVNE